MDYSNFSDEKLLDELNTWEGINPIIVKDVRNELAKRNVQEKVGEEKDKADDVMDLNGDGVVDGKDASIAGKVMAAIKKKKKSSKKKK